MSPSTPPGASRPDDLPQAIVRADRRTSWAWIVPVLALVFAGWLAFAAWRQRGHLIVVQLPQGHGLDAGDEVRYRGIAVGEVRDIELAPDLDNVRVTVGLRRRADRLARAGSRFWVVRPRLRLSGVEGMETLLGPRYLAALPGEPAADGETLARQREFVGLAEPPAVESVQPGDLEIILEATRRGSLRPGAPVRYRQVRIGTVLSAGLASDGSLVESRLHIQKAYRDLVREKTRFWFVGRMRSDLGITGLTIELDSIEEILAGGVAIATPPPGDANAVVRTGHRFPLAEEPEDEWLEWEPVIAVGNSLLPVGAVMPAPLRATIGWKQGWLGLTPKR
jgi:paraquat-inducible protein B